MRKKTAPKFGGMQKARSVRKGQIGAEDTEFMEKDLIQ